MVKDAAGLTEDSTVKEAYESLTELQRRAIDFIINEVAKRSRR